MLYCLHLPTWVRVVFRSLSLLFFFILLARVSFGSDTEYVNCISFYPFFLWFFFFYAIDQNKASVPVGLLEPFETRFKVGFKRPFAISMCSVKGPGRWGGSQLTCSETREFSDVVRFLQPGSTRIWKHDEDTDPLPKASMLKSLSHVGYCCLNVSFMNLSLHVYDRIVLEYVPTALPELYNFHDIDQNGEVLVICKWSRLCLIWRKRTFQVLFM